MSHTTTSNNPDQKKVDWLRLSRSQNVSRGIFFHLINIFGNPKNALENIGEFSLKGGRDKPIVVCSLAQAEKELELSTKIGAQILLYCDQNYPKPLKEIPDPPPLITALGNIDLLHKNILANRIRLLAKRSKQALSLFSHGTVYIHHRWRGLLAWQRSYGGIACCSVAGAWIPRSNPQIRSLSQCRSGHDVALSAW